MERVARGDIADNLISVAGVVIVPRCAQDQRHDAAEIHGDVERGFIAAEVVSYQDLIEAGSLTAARAAGKVRTEGKSYVMRPDDVVEFKFNV